VKVANPVAQVAEAGCRLWPSQRPQWPGGLVAGLGPRGV